MAGAIRWDPDGRSRLRFQRLGLDQTDAAGVSVSRLLDSKSLDLVGLGSEEQAVRDVVVPTQAEVLLAKGCIPPERAEHLPDEFVLGDRFAHALPRREAAPDVTETRADLGGQIRPCLIPFRKIANGLGEELTGEEAAAKRPFRVHAGRGAKVKNVGWASPPFGCASPAADGTKRRLPDGERPRRRLPGEGPERRW